MNSLWKFFVVSLACYSMLFALSAEVPPVEIKGVTSLPLLLEKDGAQFQVVRILATHTGGEFGAVLSAPGAESQKVTIKEGEQSLDLNVPAVEQDREIEVSLQVEGLPAVTSKVVLKPVRKWTVYLMPHSHVDIGYTKVQTDVEKDQVRFLEESIEAARKTESYPSGSQFKWNSEVLWAVDSLLRTAPEPKKKEFIQAVRKGWIELNALYGNELTALCRPEELVRLLDLACKLRRDFQVPVETAMISDVPGYTWGMVPVLAGSGVKYFSIGPNLGDRIGLTLSEWADRPFYWVSPSGDSKVLVWVHGQGYSWFHRGPLRDGERVLEYLQRLENAMFPYDIVGLRYNVGGDNGPPDFELSDFVKDWNSRYVYPKILISTARGMFREFERRYASEIPARSGDFTPYWEDGAASSAEETAQTRAAAEQLSQAEVLWSMLDPKSYPAKEFREAWRNAILYDEHTWGAHNSISEPDSDFVKAQWQIKQAFAVDAFKQSGDLLAKALSGYPAPSGPAEAVMVFNTSSWTRTEVVMLHAGRSLVGDRVTDSKGNEVPSQRLSTGELVFLAKDIAPFSSARFHLGEGAANLQGSAKAEGNTLSNGTLTLMLNEQTGAIASLKMAGLDADFVDSANGLGLNDYFYVPGKDPAGAQRSGATRISIADAGPLVASLLVESEAPGCRKLARRVIISSGVDRVDLINLVDKEKVREKEGVHFAFPFNVPDGVMRLDIPWAVVRPEADQLPGACKNWFTVQRWVDVSNQDYGVTWATVDAPLVEVGAITAETPWMKSIAPSQTLYSYVMNNYWHTNYKADQEGPTPFSYSLYPHRWFSSTEATRRGIEASQRLVVLPVMKNAKEIPSLISLDDSGVVVSSLRPTDDGKELTVRLFGASGKPEQVTPKWRKGWRPSFMLSDLTGARGSLLSDSISVSPFGMVTLNTSLPPKGGRK